jgi:beta-mannosidase
MDLDTGWQLQDAALVSQTGADISHASFHPEKWYAATVPGTVLTSLVNDGVYPEPLYGENNRPDKIPDTLCRTPYWYRTVFTVPAGYAGKKIWLNFDGINYTAEVWVNGKNLGAMKGAFSRGMFDLSDIVTAGKDATLAVMVTPQPHPGKPHEHTLANGMGGNGGQTAIDGPTFLCTIGWDWIPAIRDRDTGIWQKVFISASGPVLVREPQVTTDLPLPGLDSADVTVATTLQNVTAQPQTGILKGTFRDVSFQQPVTIAPNSSQQVSVDPKSQPSLHVVNPKLWWPNGYGPQNLYTLHLSFEMNGTISDQQDVNFGIRKITYSVPTGNNLTVSVNGVPIFCKGGNWGMDEAMKRIPRERLEAQVRMHQIANLTIIRNWVGQSTSEDFFEMCDKYGILVWDEFFQPNGSDGPSPTDLVTYMANLKETILRFRNHPSIVLWCATNERTPPPEVASGLVTMLADLDPQRYFLPCSNSEYMKETATSLHGVHSSGPYNWRPPREWYDFPAGDVFAAEIGSVSIPTLESIQGMMPQKDWENINDDWAEHDLASGASQGDQYPKRLNDRYGQAANLADFARKGQMMNYEAFRALYEGRNAKLFAPVTGVIIWMSNPAQPSFVWQLYHHDLEPNSALFATRKACEPVHIQLNEKLGTVEIINNLPTSLENAHAHLSIYNLDGTSAYEHDFDVTAPPSQMTDLGAVNWPATLTPVHFVKLTLEDTNHQLISDNFYWRALPDHQDDLKDLDKLPLVALEAKVARHDADGKCLLEVTLDNPGLQIALMAHIQLRRQHSNERVLPVYYTDNYISLIPGESKTITIEAAQADLKGETPLIAIDGWNIDVKPVSSPDAAVALNDNAQVTHWPVTNLPVVASTYVYYLPASDQFKINCGGAEDADDFQSDVNYFGGSTGGGGRDSVITLPASHAGPLIMYQNERWGQFSYKFAMKPLPAGQTYTAWLHFVEATYNEPGKRRFAVKINDQQVLSDFDPLKEAGGKFKAIVREFTGLTPDDKGDIVIKFENGASDSPEINGIEIVPSGS